VLNVETGNARSAGKATDYCLGVASSSATPSVLTNIFWEFFVTQGSVRIVHHLG
jgi:hypothetical protein